MGSAAIAIRSSAYILDIDVALVVDVAKQPLELGKRFPNVLLFLGLRVGLVGDLDVEVEAGFSVHGQRNASNDPVIGADVVMTIAVTSGFFLRTRLVSSISDAAT